MQIIPTILEKDFLEAEKKINFIKDFVRWVQIDVIDGSFSEGKSFELELINTLGIEGGLWDVHLMVNEPEKWVNKCDFIGASRIIGQVEKMSDRQRFIKKVKDLGIEVGLAFDTDTQIDEDITENVDLVLLMSRKSGFRANDFDEKIFSRIEKLKEIKEKNNLDFKIAIDGGVNFSNIEEVKESKIDIAYCGSVIFNGNVKENFKKIREA